MSILTPVSSIILVITFPPGPITSLILSGFIFIVIILGAYLDKCGLGASIVFLISFNMCSLPTLACARAVLSISSSIPAIFISICIAVIPCSVPATLKSISPKWSSIPCISESIAIFPSCSIRPIAIPATISFIGTPASKSDKVEPQTLP